MAQTYGARPSSLLGFEPSDWTGWQFDNAVMFFGRWVEAHLEERDKQGKPVHKIENLLKPYREAQAEPQYASLRGLVTRKVQVKPDGTWD